MNMELIHQIEQRALPELNRISNGLEAEFPEYEFRVFSNSGGDITPNPWHVMGVSCLFHKDWDNLPNEVMIQIDATSLKSAPKLWAGSKQKAPADEPDVVEIILTIEEKLGVEIKDEEIGETAQGATTGLTVKRLIEVVSKKKKA